MELEEILRRKFYREQLERQGGPDFPALISCDGMTDSEKNDFINFIYGQLKEREAQNEALHAKLDAQMDRFDKLQATLDAISSQLAESNKMKEVLQKGFDNMQAQLIVMKDELVKTQKELRKSQREAKKYRELYEVLRDEKFVTRSQKSKQGKTKGRDDDKDDWDGTSTPASESTPVEAENPSPEANSEKQPEPRPYRQGKKYETMHADGAKKAYRCDRSLIPEGCKITKVEFRKRIHEEKRLVTVLCEYITYVDPEGKAHTKYFPVRDIATAIVGQESKEELGLDEDVEMMGGAAPEWFPGTHATIDMLVELVFNKYVMETPVYREMTRLMEQRFKTCRQTVQNWLARGAKHLKHIVPVLKEIALEKDSIVHCDETWCRVKIMDKYKKAYIWCLVNKSAKIIIFFYDNGSRGRKVLTDFIGEAEIAALQSDAYNVYKYLDSELTEIEHVCCMAHVRARFLKALIQGKDERARFFLDRINELYAMEAFYKKNKFPPDRIKGERHNARTIEIITEMRMELTRLLTMEEQKSDLLTKALNYLDNSWDQVMAWRNDGRYNIDNSEAERNIRPMTIERSNSKSFGSHEGVEISAVYHTIIATCKAQAVSVCEYLKQFFTACVNGRTDYENLTPMMLCQPVK